MTSVGGVSLIDLKGVAEPVTKLIDVISKGIGVAYEPTHIKRIAKANADAQKIAVRANIEAEEIRARASTRLAQVEVRRQKNIEVIAERAFSELPSTASSQTPSEDWVSSFFNLCQDVSDDELQTLWARLLAGEVSNPGQYSIRTLQTLKTLNSREATVFAKYCATVWTFVNKNERVCARVIGAENNAFLNSLVQHMDVIHLAEIGLISYKNLRTIVSNGRPTEYDYIERSDRRFSLTPSSVWYNPLSWLAFILLPQSFEMEFLTEIGTELFQVVGAEVETQLTVATAADLRSVGIRMKTLPLTPL